MPVTIIVFGITPPGTMKEPSESAKRPRSATIFKPSIIADTEEKMVVLAVAGVKPEILLSTPGMPPF